MKVCINFHFGDKLKSSYAKFYYSGILTLVLGILILGCWRPLYNLFVSSNLILKNDTEMYKIWSSTEDIPVYFTIYLFNWTNPESTLIKHEKPRFMESGPYVFRLREIKTNIQWNHNDTVSFRYQRRYNFVPEMSKGSENDHITAINSVAISLVNFFKNIPTPGKHVLDFLMEFTEKSLYVTKTAKTWIFDGYDDEILTLTDYFRKVMPKLQFPGRFAWYYGKNMTDFYDFNMYTGKSDENYEGLLNSMNYKTECQSYFGQCDRIQGSLGSLWPQNTTKLNETYFFLPEMCGAFRLQNSGPKTVHGIDGVRFDGNLDTFDNGLKFEENSCFQRNNIFRSGIRDLSRIMQTPIFASFPHFYAADEYFRNAIDGLKPDPKKHEFYVILQKDFSVVLDAHFRLQLNIHLQPIQGFPSLKNVPELFIPILWFEIHPKLPQDSIDKLKLLFNGVPYLLSTCGIAFTILGCTLITYALLLQRKNRISDTYKTTR